MLTGLDLQELREEIRDPKRGFSLIRGFYSIDEVDRYRKECEDFIPRAPIINTHLVSPAMEDYVYPQFVERVFRGLQIYQFPKNHEDTETGAFFQKAIDLRNEVEGGWADEEFLREIGGEQIYAQVNAHVPGNRPVDPHRDFDPAFPKPVLQVWVPLTQPGRDYLKGNLVIYSKTGEAHRIEDELTVNKGDLLLFDKALLHEVEPMFSARDGGDLARWNVVIGARQRPDSRLRLAYRKLLFMQPLWFVVRETRPLRVLMKRAFRSEN